MSRAAWLQQAERSNVWTLRLMIWLTLKLGRPLTRLLLYPICLYFVLFSMRARRASRRYLERALARRVGWKEIFLHYLTFASTIHDRIFLLTGHYQDFQVNVHGADALKETLARGQGCLMVGAHLGSFEILRALGDRDAGVVLNILAHHGNAAKTVQVFQALNPDLLPRIIQVGMPDTVLKVQECLERGEVVALLGDRMLDSDKAAQCDFFGHRAAFPEGPILLASILKVPVVLCFGLYRGGKAYDIHFEVLAETIHIDRRQRSAAAQQWMQRYAARLEHYCRQAPYNWFNFYDFWVSEP